MSVGVLSKEERIELLDLCEDPIEEEPKCSDCIHFNACPKGCGMGFCIVIEDWLYDDDETCEEFEW